MPTDEPVMKNAPMRIRAGEPVSGNYTQMAGYGYGEEGSGFFIH